MSLELFELELLGGGVERRYRKMRPEIDRMPWGTLDVSEYPAAALIPVRRAWTEAAFQEHRTGAACCAALRLLIEARAPLDLIAMASRFPLDEMVHVELCARMAMELGGGSELRHDPSRLVSDPDPNLPPLLRAADLITRVFCVGEAVSLPLLHGTWRAARHPLPKAVFGRIVKDEAAHGTFGWLFFDWARPSLEPQHIEHLRRVAGAAIASFRANILETGRKPVPLGDHHPLGWMPADAYAALAERSLEQKVIRPLRERGILAGA